MTSIAKAFVEKAISNNPVTVFSKSFCPFCKAAKNTLTKYSAPYKAYELDKIGKYGILHLFKS